MLSDVYFVVMPFGKKDVPEKSNVEAPAEECQRRGASVRLMLALPRLGFVSMSVAFAGNDWVRRFDQLANICEVADQVA
jgi:hypothetical protein